MNLKPKFSIIIPVYNTEIYLDKCVQSALHQTCRDIEIILIDDGSRDNSPAMCDEYARTDDRVRVIHKKNGGQADARNLGMEAAAGDYIVFLDSDDFMSEDGCEQLLRFTQDECDIIIVSAVYAHNQKRVGRCLNKTGEFFRGTEYMKEAYRANAMPIMAPWQFVYKKAFIEENKLRFKTGFVHEDDHFISRTFLLADKVVESDICYYQYFIREGSTTVNKDMRRNADDLLTICAELREIFEKLQDDELKKLLIDSLAMKYLNLFQTGKLYQYGKAYLRKQFVWNHAYRLKTRMKALLYCASPELYWHINDLSKRLR